MRYLDEIRKMNLPPEEYVIHGGGTLAVRGLRENGDVDVLVTRALWDRLAKEYPVSIRKGDKGRYIQVGHVEIWPESARFYGLDAGLLIRDHEIIDDLPFAKLKYVVQYKKAMSREKDLKDLELIGEYLAEAKQ